MPRPLIPRQDVQIIGAGPAGCLAALTATREGSAVTLYEKSAFPRHKVCGEFLSPEAAKLFDRLAVLPAFLEQHPHPIRQANVHIGAATKRWTLDEPAFGISRFALDHFLLNQALARGAALIRETASPATTAAGPTVIASGRQNRAPAGRRLFGFKAHFTGPLTDRIDLLFGTDVYIGISSIENGATNVCGLASEELLRQHHFHPDLLLASHARLSERLQPLTRSMDWLITGPLVYGGKFDEASPPDVYLAGDALGFVDPFTGSGMLGALSTGFLAGLACARAIPSTVHLRRCHEVLGSQYQAAGLFRKLIRWGIADKLAWMLPGQRIFDLTRPAVDRALADIHA